MTTGGENSHRPADVSVRRALFNMGVKAGGTAAEKAAQLGLVVVAAPLLGAATFGRYAVATSVAAIMAFGIDLGLTLWVTRTLARDPAARPAALATAFRLRLWASVPYLAALGVAAVLVHPPVAMLALGLAAMARSFLDLPRAVFRAEERMDRDSWAGGVSAFAATAAGLGALVLAGGGLPALALGVAAGTTAGACYGFALLGRGNGGGGLTRALASAPFDRALARRMLRQSLPFWLAGIFSLVYARGDVLLVWALAGDAEAGAYRAAGQLYEVGKHLPNLVLTAFFPQLARAYVRSRADLLRLERSIALGLVGAGIAGGAVLAAAAGPVVRLGFGEEFAHTVPCLRLLALAVPLTFLNFGLLHFLVARDRAGLNVVFSALMIPVAVIANLALVPRFGAAGAAAATIAVEAALTTCCLLALRQVRRET